MWLLFNSESLVLSCSDGEHLNILKSQTEERALTELIVAGSGEPSESWCYRRRLPGDFSWCTELFSSSVHIDVLLMHLTSGVSSPEFSAFSSYRFSWTVAMDRTPRSGIVVGPAAVVLLDIHYTRPHCFSCGCASLSRSPSKLNQSRQMAAFRDPGPVCSWWGLLGLL